MQMTNVEGEMTDPIKSATAAMTWKRKYEVADAAAREMAAHCDARVAEMQAQLTEAVEALRPFAHAAEEWHEMGDTRGLTGGDSLTVGDLRRARAIVAKHDPAGKGE